MRAVVLTARPLGVALALVLGCSSAPEELRLVGTVERTLVELAAPASEVVLEVAVERGDRVEPGQLLVRLDGTLADAEIAGAEAELAGAQTAVVIAESELGRLRTLRGARVASEQALERAQLARAEAHARRREAQALLAAARKRRDDLDLRTPVTGVVDQLPFDPGERVPAGAVLAVLLQDADPWVRVWVPEERFVEVGPGMAAEIRIDGLATPLRGRVLDVAREPEFTPHYALTERDRVHLVYETRVRIEDAPLELRPGVPAEVWIGPRVEAAR